MVEGGNTYDKYASANPLERRVVSQFLATLTSLAERSGARVAHEVGCGEGEISMRLAAAGLSVRGSDVSAEVIEEARARASARGLQIPFATRSIDELDPSVDAAELLVCCEVIEHLPSPEAAVGRLASLADPWLLTSVPREPMWRALNIARGAYLREWGNTPGHLNHFSRRSFVELLAGRFEVVAVRSPLPWTVALCRSRDRRLPPADTA